MKLLQQLPDLLTAPLSGLEIALAYIIGGTIRGMVNGILVLLVGVILIDLPNPEDIKDYAFLKDETLSIQNYGYEVFYKGFQNGALEKMNWRGGEIFAYKETGGSNLDMEDECFDPTGKQLSLDTDIYSKYDIILVVSTFSASLTKMILFLL